MKVVPPQAKVLVTTHGDHVLLTGRSNDVREEESIESVYLFQTLLLYIYDAPMKLFSAVLPT